MPVVEYRADKDASPPRRPSGYIDGMIPALLLALSLAATGASLPAASGAPLQLTGVVREAAPTPGCAFSGGGVICGGQHPSGEPMPARTVIPPADPTPSPSPSPSDPAAPLAPSPRPPAATPTPTPAIGDESPSAAPVQTALGVLAGGILLLGAGLLAASWWRGRHGDSAGPTIRG
jgi:hypothetical protein